MSIWDEDPIPAPLRVAREIRRARARRERLHGRLDARSRIVRVCDSCGLFIWPLQPHIRLETRRGTRRYHRARCPGDPMPPAHERLEGFNAFLGGLAAVLATGGLVALCLLLAGWKP
jgi:hypothetical protein